MNSKGAESAGPGRIETTIAFVRSLVAWQDAVSVTAAGPPQRGLFAPVDLVAAATNPTVAGEWVSFLSTLVKANAEIVAEGKRKGGPEAELGNLQTLGDYLRRAHKHAEEHVKSFSVR